MDNKIQKKFIKLNNIKKLEKDSFISKYKPVNISLSDDTELKTFLKTKKESEKKALKIKLKF
jgi:hypothetical protein